MEKMCSSCLLPTLFTRLHSFEKKKESKEKNNHIRIPRGEQHQNIPQSTIKSHATFTESLIPYLSHPHLLEMGSYGPESLTEPTGVTAQLSQWISNVQLSDIPPEVLERAKYQLLDGVACALVGAHVPWSEKYVEATAEYEPAGDYSVIGWDKVCEIGPLIKKAGSTSSVEQDGR